MFKSTFFCFILGKCDKIMKIVIRTKFRQFLHSIYNTMKKLFHNELDK